MAARSRLFELNSAIEVEGWLRDKLEEVASATQAKGEHLARFGQPTARCVISENALRS
jgi:hypothetical protein